MEYYTIVIQIKISDTPLGTGAELDLRHSIEDHFIDVFDKLNNGFCDGGQSGSGTMEIFIEQITDINSALDIVKGKMKKIKLGMDYKIVWTLFKKDEWKVYFATKKNLLLNFDFFKFE
jgi:hypothetical protein